MMLSTSTVIPSFLRKKNHLLHILVVMSLEHFIAEYVAQKQPIKIKNYHQQCLSFLVAGKCVGETVFLPEHRHVDVLNRGGLWKVNKDVIAILVLLKLISCHPRRNYKIKSYPKI